MSVAGFAGMLVIKCFFDRSMKNFILSKGYVPVAKDDFYLFFNVSAILCAVLLALTLISAATYILQKPKATKFTVFTVTFSPVLCIIAILMVSVFYSYLTHGAEFTLWYYVMLCGISEALLFALPLCVTKAHRTELAKSQKSKKKIKK